jgi:hypothetical protein
MAFPTALTSRVLIALNGVEGPEYYQAGDALMAPGMVVTYDDADEVKICTSTAKPLGIVGCDADHDLSTVYSLGERIPIWLIGSGVDIYVKCKDAGASHTIERNSIIDSPHSTTFVGQGALIDTLVATTAVTVRNVSSFFWIGTALEAGSLTTAVARYIPVKLSF